MHAGRRRRNAEYLACAAGERRGCWLPPLLLLPRCSCEAPDCTYSALIASKVSSGLSERGLSEKRDGFSDQIDISRSLVLFPSLSLVGVNLESEEGGRSVHTNTHTDHMEQRDRR